MSELLVALIWQFPKFRLHHWPELPQTLVDPKINYPTLRVQHEGAEGQHRDGSHGCEVPSEESNAFASPLPVLREWFVMMLGTLTFYTVIVLFFCRTLSHKFVVSRWNNNCPRWCVMLFFWLRSRYTNFLVPGHQQKPCISITSQQRLSTLQHKWNSTTYESYSTHQKLKLPINIF